MKTLATILTLVITTSAAAAFEEVEPTGFGAFYFEVSDAWALLESIEVAEEGYGEDWKAVKYFPPEVLAAAEDFEIAGYLVPVYAEAELKHLVLVPWPTNCPFCGTAGAGYGPLIEVTLKRGITGVAEGSLLRVRGKLEFIESPDTLQAYKLVDAIHLDVPEG